MTEIIDHAHFGILIVESLRIVSYPNVCNVELSTGTNIATRLRYVYKKFRPIPTYGFGFYPVPVAVTILNAIHTIFRPKSACQFQILTPEMPPICEILTPLGLWAESGSSTGSGTGYYQSITVSFISFHIECMLGVSVPVRFSETNTLYR